MKHFSQHLRHNARRAVTLVEVLFAIGVIMIGLLGLLSILPLAGKRAKDSVALSTSANYAESIFAKLKAEKYFSSNRLKPFEENNLIESKVFGNNSAVTLGSGGPVPSFCIDPLFRATVDSSLSALPKPGSYLAGAFPFYNQKFTPPANPLAAPQSTTQMYPRMFRVAPKSRTQPTFLDQATSWSIAELPDELAITRPEDKTLATRVSTGVYDGPTKKWTRKLPGGKFTWMATVNPLPGGVYASVAVVVFKARERNIKAFDPPLPSEPTNEKSERLAKVVDWVGFSGGGGGVVTLEGDNQVDNSLIQGDWIMLSRYFRHINGFRDVHHWYRVMQCDDVPVGLGLPWRKTVTLDGPDWTFTDHPDLQARDQDDALYIIAASDASGTLNVSSETQATILSNVISVTERTMKLSDL